MDARNDVRHQLGQRTIVTALWQTDAELFALARRELFVAAVGDVLDKLGFQHQFLDPRLKPIDPSMIIIGRAMPVLEADYFVQRQPGNNPLSDKPFGLMLEALDDLGRDEVYVCAGSSGPYALWGGLSRPGRAIAAPRARSCTAFIATPTRFLLSPSPLPHSVRTHKTRGRAARCSTGVCPSRPMAFASSQAT